MRYGAELIQLEGFNTVLRSAFFTRFSHLLGDLSRTAVVLGLLSACTFYPTNGNAYSVDQGQQNFSSSVFHADQAEKMFRFVFDVIQDRYLEPTDLSELTIEGLKGLETLDTGLTTVRNGSTLVISSSDRVIATLPLPTSKDPRTWSRIMVESISLARTQSPSLLKDGNETIYQAVIDAFLAHLDRFSRYAGAQEAKANRDNRNGFGGVGIRYQLKKNALHVDDVLPDTPAARAGLKIGDDITRIDGVAVEALNNDRGLVRNHLRGPINSELLLTLSRDGSQRSVRLRRGLVVPQTVSLKSVTDGIAQIAVNSFNQSTTTGLSDAIAAARKDALPSLRGVILDLRGNPGGLLDQAVDVADLFMSRGRIVFTKGRHPESMQSYSATPGDILDGLPMVVLLDGRSASAAEIVGAALQDSGRAVVVGSTSYGKGTVQTVVRLPNDGEMTLTWSRFHSPSGYALHGLGVLPTICIDNQSEGPNEAILMSLNGSPAIGAPGGPISTFSPEARISRQPVASHMAEWRHTPLWDTAARGHLRNLCPPRDQEKWAADLGAAQELINNRDLYMRALLVTSPQSAQR